MRSAGPGASRPERGPSLAMEPIANRRFEISNVRDLLACLRNAIFSCMVSDALNLEGEWVGHYAGHFDEFIRIVQNGSAVEAWKITGDDYVPAGALTWRADLETGRGFGQIAEQEFRNPR